MFLLPLRNFYHHPRLRRLHVFLLRSSIPAILWLFAIAMVVAALKAAPPVIAYPVLPLVPDSTESVDPEQQEKILETPSVLDTTLDKGEEGQSWSKESAVDTTMQDTVDAHADSSRFVFVDSTARVTHFLHRRYDPIIANGIAPWTSPFYLKSPEQYRREISLDSTGRIVTIRETVADKDVKIPITMTLEQYIEQRTKLEQQRRWLAIVGDYRLPEQQEGLESVLGQFTNIDIPVPANPFLSIFGPPRINLRISGAVDIRAAFRNQKSDQQTTAVQDQVRNEPDFNQEVQINVSGTIGDKLNILADWNTQRVFEYENQLKIKYTGYEDEIVQSVEGGNVSFGNLPSLVGSSQALFGIKAKFQTGPLFLTTLVSQKKGQVKEITVTGGAQRQKREIRPYDYSKNHFFLDTLYRRFYDQLNATQILQPTPEIEQYKIKDIEVWVSITSNQQQNQAKNAIVHIDLPPLDSARQSYPDSLRNASPVPGRIDRHQFIKLNPNEYIRHDYEGYITINTSLLDQQIVGVAYRIEGATTAQDDDRYFGELQSDSSTIVLKMLKPNNLQPTYRQAWNLMLKNIYYVGGTGLSSNNFQVKIFRGQTLSDATEQILGSQRTLLNILGLDRFGANNIEPFPDGNFDFIAGYTIDPARGEIIFPTLEPFRTSIQAFIHDSLQYTQPDSIDYVFHEVYDTTAFAANNSVRNKYIIDVEFEAAQRSSYSLGFNLVEGSVKVLLNGRTLTPNVDYTIDYITGEVVIRNPAALVPGANLEIKYEQNDLFQIASKTLIGARGEMSPFPNTNLGFTVMNLNKQTLSDKVRLGEEPTNNTILGVDASTSFDLAPVTDALNVLPLYQTREMSTMRFGAEAAYMVPDPNTKKSPIASDRGEAIAYIDDFEGARRTLPLGHSFGSWTLSSPPVRFVGSQEIARSTDMKAKLSWYNPYPSGVVVTDIWPERKVRRGDEQVPVLNLDYFPSQRGMYNYSINPDSTLHAEGTPFDDQVERRRNWSGLMKYLSTTATNLLEQNIGFLEIWIKTEGSDPDDIKRGRLYVNLGAISEAVITAPADSAIRQFYQTHRQRTLERDKPFSEDLVLYPNPNGALNEEGGRTEDVGIDMLTDAEERIAFNWLGTQADPSGDNYSYTTGSPDFSRINGLDGNRQSPAGLFPNTEDLNNNFSRDVLNSYLEYEIPLDSVYIDSLGFERTNNPYIVGGGFNGWHQFRIPLTAPTRIVSQTPQAPQDILQNLQYARIYFSGFSHPVRVRIADIALVGNQWQELTRNDSVLRVSVVNIEDNPNYKSPPGVIRERDRTQPDQDVFANEQSLALILTNLPVDSVRQAVKYFPAVRPLDVFNYRAMKMFVHGEPYNPGTNPPRGFKFNNINDYDAAIFLRFGADTSNFYEYRQPIVPGWDDMEIVFSDLTAIKTLRQVRGDSTHLLSNPFPVQGKPGAEYRIKGNPTLTNIRAMWVGVVNMTSRTTVSRPLTGDVWINELRLIGVDDRSGFAYRFDTQIKLADLGDVSFNFSKMDPFFHGLEDRFGSRVTSQNWGIGVNLGLDKFFPSTWQGTALPFSYSHTENMSVPRYLPGTDVEVAGAASRAPTPDIADSLRIATQTFRVTETYTVPNLRIGLPSQAWYIRDIVNRFSWSFNYTTSRERSPIIARRTSWLWSGRMGYAVSLPPDYYVEPFSSLFDGVWLLDDFKNMKIYYAPTSFSTGLSVHRSRTYERARGIAGDRPTARSFTASRSAGFGYKLTEGGLSNISGEYSLNVESNLTHLETNQFGFQRPFSSILSDIFFSDRFINFGRDGRYGQRFTANSRPKFPTSLGIDRFVDLTMGYSVNYAWQNNFQQGDLGKSAGWDNNINVTMNLRLKSLTDPWFTFTESGPPKLPPQEESRRRRSAEEMMPQDTTRQDTTRIDIDDKGAGDPLKGTWENLKRILQIAIKTPLLDYETINLTYTQTNRMGNAGVLGGPGFLNFWGRVPFFQEQVLEYGPSRLYQLGLASDPSGKVLINSSSSFPFVRFGMTRGLRAAGVQMTDQFTQTNRLTLRTNRALWEGADLELNWNVGWSFTKSTTLRTDTLGVPTVSSEVTQGSIERSFFTLPPVLLFKIFKSNLSEVGKRYNIAKRNTADTRSDDVKLAEAFENGLETLPIFKKVFGDYFPRVNYTFRWRGLERLSLLSNTVERLELEHAYTSSFTRQWRGNPDGGQRIDGGRIGYGFTPLFGISGSMRDFLKGSLQGNIRYTTSTTYDLNAVVRSIAETYSQEIALTLTYSRRGFEFLLFGLSLSNDLEMGVTYSLTKNSSRTYDVNTLETNTTGQPLQGSTRTTLEPRIRYVLSSRVTASIFYRYTKLEPDRAGSYIPGTTTNEAGLDVHIAIQ